MQQHAHWQYGLNSGWSNVMKLSLFFPCEVREGQDYGSLLASRLSTSSWARGNLPEAESRVEKSLLVSESWSIRDYSICIDPL